MLIESRPALDPELAVLVTAEQRETRADRAPHPDVAHLVAVVGGRAVACGGWQPMPDGAAEFARMYVRPAFRGRGIARQLIVAIEEEALAAGHPVIRLAAGATPAIALFQSSGYHQIPAYGEYTGDRPQARVCFAKRLGALVQ